MILTNQYLIVVYLIMTIISLYAIFIKKHINKYTLLFSIYLIITFVSSLYYYRTLTFEDILDNNKYKVLFDSSSQVVAEDVKNTSLKSANIIYNLKQINIKNTSKSYKKIEKSFLEEKNSYIIKNMGQNIFRITILGNYEYIEYGGKYYKIVK